MLFAMGGIEQVRLKTLATPSLTSRAPLPPPHMLPTMLDVLGGGGGASWLIPDARSWRTPTTCLRISSVVLPTRPQPKPPPAAYSPTYLHEMISSTHSKLDVSYVGSDVKLGSVPVLDADVFRLLVVRTKPPSTKPPPRPRPVTREEEEVTPPHPHTKATRGRNAPKRLRF